MTYKALRCTRAMTIVVAFLLTTVLSEAQTYTISVPVKNPAIARVKITFEGTGLAGMQITATGSNPSIGALTFNGGAPFGVTPGVTDSAGDFIFVDNGPVVGNSIVIQYVRNGHFAGGNQFCTTNAAGTVAETLTLTVTGAGTINDFRYNSYSVPGSQGVQAVDCSKAIRRVSAGASVVASGAGAGQDFGRHPLDVVMVLDRSGSMELPIDPADLDLTHTRMAALKSAAGEFVDHFLQADPDNHAGADRLATVFYSSDTIPADQTGVTFVRRDAVNNWQPIKTTILNQTTDGMTAMGQGLQVAIDGWKSHSNPATDDSTIVLLTDGLQNVGPQVTLCSGTQNEALNPGCGPDDPGTCQAGFARLFKCGIPMETLALGVAADHDLLDKISQQTGGITTQAVTTFSLATGFADSLVDLLKGNSESILFRVEDTFSPSGGGGQLRQTLIDGSVKRAIFVLGWQPVRGQTGLDLQIIPPGGCTGNPPTCTPVSPTVRSDGPTWTVQSVDIPAKGPTGEWSVRVVPQPVIGMAQPGRTGPSADVSGEPRIITVAAAGDPGAQLVTGAMTRSAAAPVQTLPNIPYHLAGYAVEGRLSYRLTFAGIGQGTGDSIGLQAQMNYNGKPLTSLPKGAITVRVERPNTGQGTYLHDTQVPDSVLNNEPTPGDTTTPYERKLQFLAKDLTNVISPHLLPTQYEMKDNGDAQSGDLKADDGVYSAKIADTSRPGLYRFTVSMDWDLPATGKIHRIEVLEREVKVNVTTGDSLVTVTPGATPETWIFHVTPKDHFGNFTGPGFGNRLSVKGGTISGLVADLHQTGSYDITVTGVPQSSLPNVVVSLDGTPVVDCKHSNCGGGGNNKFAIFADLGAAIPNGTFSNVVNTGVSFNAGLEYILNTHFSAEGIFGVHHFPGKIAGDVTAVQFTGGGKVYLTNSPNRVFARAGLGGYHFTSGTTSFGGYFGAGLLHEFNSHFGLEGVYTFHAVNTPGAATKFSTVQGGVRYAF